MSRREAGHAADLVRTSVATIPATSPAVRDGDAGEGLHEKSFTDVHASPPFGVRPWVPAGTQDKDASHHAQHSRVAVQAPQSLSPLAQEEPRPNDGGGWQLGDVNPGKHVVVEPPVSLASWRY